MRRYEYEILVAGKWETVYGTTSGMREGWLSWKDDDGCVGLSRPGTWRDPLENSGTPAPNDEQ
jgi:hypothetical protein